MKARKAIRELRRQLRSNPDNLVARVRLASLLCETGKQGEAVQLYLSVASAYAEQGRLSQAIAVCKSSLDVDPTHRQTQDLLASLELRRLEEDSADARSQTARPVPPLRAPPLGAPAEEERVTSPASVGDSLSPIRRSAPDSLPPALPPEPGRERRAKGYSSPPPTDTVALQPRRPNVDETVVGAVPAPLSSRPTIDLEETGALAPPLPEPRRSSRKSTDLEPTRVLRESPADEEEPTRVADDAAWAPGPRSRAAAAASDSDYGDDDDEFDATIVDDGQRFADLLESASAAAGGGVDTDEILQGKSTGKLARPAAPAVDGALLKPFAGISPRAMEELAARAIPRRIAGGSVVVREGEAGDSCFVVASGEVRVLKRNPLDSHGDLIEVARLGEGELFGEFALVGDRQRHASVQTVNACVLYEISRGVVDSLAEKEPEVRPNLERFYRVRMLETLMATAPFFQPLAPENRRELAQQFAPVHAQPGNRIVLEGQRAGGFYLVVLGAVEISKQLGGGQSLHVATLGEGAYFGEMSLLRGDVARATVTAAGAAELAVLPAKKFYALVASNPVLWAQVRDEANRREIEMHRIVAGVTGTV